jgi:CheY-like chemotaxis protein
MSGDASILVVEDVPGNLRLPEAVLASRGYDVVRATKPPTCWRLLVLRKRGARN